MPWRIDVDITKKGKKKIADKGTCFHCNQDGHWRRNCPQYLAEKKAEKAEAAKIGKYDLLVIESCLVENENSIWILDSGATNHVCSSV